MYKREKYLSQLRPFYDVDLIKVLTGIRRCGKSVLLTEIMEELKSNGVKENQIIYINYEYEDFNSLLTEETLNEYLENKLQKDKKTYIFIDEIQKVKGWERVVNSLKAKYKEKVSIFITGSNGDLLSGELATNISGRYVSLKVYPFTFKEVCEYLGIEDKSKYELKETFDNYLIWGGMPQRFVFKEPEHIKMYLSDVYNTIVVKDIISRYNIKELSTFNKILSYIVTTPSQTFSADNMVNQFLSENVKVSKTTICDYLEYMTNAYLISKAEKYDVRGKRIINGKYKYYLTDLGIGQIENKERKKQIGAYLENIVYNELLSRGYNVTIGSLKTGEIDFIATKFEEKIYIQVTNTIDENNETREFGAFSVITDNFPKYVISTDTIDLSRDGIIHKNIIDWLLER